MNEYHLQIRHMITIYSSKRTPYGYHIKTFSGHYFDFSLDIDTGIIIVIKKKKKMCSVVLSDTVSDVESGFS